MRKLNFPSKEETTKTGEDKSGFKYSEKFGWHLKATGHLIDCSIGLIKEDGSVESFWPGNDQIDFSLSPISDFHKERNTGWFFHMGDEPAENEKQNKSVLFLNISEKILEKICDQILSERLAELKISVWVDVFMSEVDRGLWQPGISSIYYIEEGCPINLAYLLDIQASRPAEKTISMGNEKINHLDIEDCVTNQSVSKESDREMSLNDLLSAQIEMLNHVNQRLGSFRTVGILL